MKTKNILKTAGLIVSISFSLITLNSCDDNNDSSTEVGVPAISSTAFVSALNENPNFDVLLVSPSIDSEGFILIYDPLTDTIDALKISEWSADISASDFYYDNSASNFFDLYKLNSEKYINLTTRKFFVLEGSPVNDIPVNLAPSRTSLNFFEFNLISTSGSDPDEVGHTTSIKFTSVSDLEIVYNIDGSLETESGTYSVDLVSDSVIEVTEYTQDGTGKYTFTFTDNDSGFYREDFTSDSGGSAYFEGVFSLFE